MFLTEYARILNSYSQFVGCSHSNRFVIKPEGVCNVFLMYF